MPRPRDPATDAIYATGMLATVLQLLKLPDGTVKVLVEGLTRAKIAQYTRTDEFYEARAEVLAEEIGDKVEAEALARSVAGDFENYAKLNKKISPEVVQSVGQIEDYSKLADTVAATTADQGQRQAGRCSRSISVAKRLEKVLGLMESEISCCRSRSASARASSARWRRRSASTTSTSR